MRRQVDWDKIEAALTRRRAENELSRFVFPSAYTAWTKPISLAAVLRHSLLSFLLLAACGATFLIVLPAIAAAYIVTDYNVTHTHSVPWRYFIFLWRMGITHIWGDCGPAGILLALTASAQTAFLFALRWTWNRRADRLNHEGPPMPEAVAAVPGVWPPPPTALTGDAPEP